MSNVTLMCIISRVKEELVPLPGRCTAGRTGLAAGCARVWFKREQHGLVQQLALRKGCCKK